jgi:hypothetical protein
MLYRGHSENHDPALPLSLPCRVLAKVANWTLQKRQKTVTELKPHPADVIPIKRNARRKGDHLAQIGKIGLLP